MELSTFLRQAHPDYRSAGLVAVYSSPLWACASERSRGIQSIGSQCAHHQDRTLEALARRGPGFSAEWWEVDVDVGPASRRLKADKTSNCSLRGPFDLRPRPPFPSNRVALDNTRMRKGSLRLLNQFDARNWHHEP